MASSSYEHNIKIKQKQQHELTERCIKQAGNHPHVQQNFVLSCVRYTSVAHSEREKHKSLLFFYIYLIRGGRLHHQGGVDPCLVEGDLDPKLPSLENLVFSFGVLANGLDPR